MTDVIETTATEQAQAWANDYLEKLNEATNRRLTALAAPGNGNGAQLAAGEPTVGSYVAFDVAVTSPVQFIGLPPYQPSKIIAAGEPAFIFAFLFVNPTVDVGAGFAVPPTVQLGGRTWRLSLDQLNLTSATTLIRARCRWGPSPPPRRPCPWPSSRWPRPTPARTRR